MARKMRKIDDIDDLGSDECLGPAVGSSIRPPTSALLAKVKDDSSPTASFDPLMVGHFADPDPTKMYL